MTLKSIVLPSVLPDNWRVVMLRFLLCEPITDGPHETPEFISEGIPFLSVDGIQDGELDLLNTRFISPEQHAQFIIRKLDQNGMIFCLERRLQQAKLHESRQTKCLASGHRLLF